MRILPYKDSRLLVSDNLSDEKAKLLFDTISNRSYTVSTILKKNQRSSVYKINFEGKDLVLKVPKEKNNRKWIRFLTWFRKGEAFKNILGMIKLRGKGIKTTVPLLAAERRALGMVVDSWLLYEYLDGVTCLDHPEHYPSVVKKLSEMHAKNFLHGDPQIRNFISYQDEIYVIDSNPKSAANAFSRAYEWAYLRKSAPGIENLFGDINDWWLYKVAFRYDLYERKFARQRRRVKRAIKDLFF